MIPFNKTALTLAAALALCAALPAHAQNAPVPAAVAAAADKGQVHEIVVTAERRSADPQKTAQASWNRAKAAVFTNANLSWESPNGTYQVTGYVRNIGDLKIRSSYSFQDSSVTVSDPRTFGLVLQAHY